MSKNPMEEMSMPCPYDECDGDGILHEDDGTDGARDRLCRCNPKHEENRDVDVNSQGMRE